MSQTGPETEPVANEGSGDEAAPRDESLQYNPFKWTIRAFQAGGLNQWEEYALDALFAVVLVILALGIANAI